MHHAPGQISGNARTVVMRFRAVLRTCCVRSPDSGSQGPRRWRPWSREETRRLTKRGASPGADPMPGGLGKPVQPRLDRLPPEDPRPVPDPRRGQRPAGTGRPRRGGDATATRPLCQRPRGLQRLGWPGRDPSNGERHPLSWRVSYRAIVTQVHKRADPRAWLRAAELGRPGSGLNRLPDRDLAHGGADPGTEDAGDSRGGSGPRRSR